MATISRLFLLVLFSVLMTNPSHTQNPDRQQILDARVKMFLDSHADQWHDLNVPAVDGKLLHDLILKGKYTRALEIGTSTGLSAIWMAWALSKTGGKLITIEIDKVRYEKALANFEEAGLSGFIDARLADAHDLVKKLEGPFDFVFSDADKEWYKQYFIDVAPKLVVGGCFTAHNVLGRHGGKPGTRQYAKYVIRLRNFKTTFNSDGAGVAMSYKKSEH